MSVTALTKNLVETVFSLLIMFLILGTDSVIMRHMLWSLLASLFSISTSLLFRLASLRVAGMLPKHGWPFHLSI